jgi:hypothetical protein
MYRIGAGDQQGRNDTAKLGYMSLEIYDSGHVVHCHRSYGETAADGATVSSTALEMPHTKTSNLTDIYVDMRHAWSEEMVVAPSGAVDEFNRKKSRNDYPLMAMWEMGLRGMRVPFQDLVEHGTRRRMRLIQKLGHRFHIYHYGMPSATESALLCEHSELVERLELVLNWENIDDLVEAIRVLRKRTGIPVVLSRVNRKDVAKIFGGRFNHLISHGFSLADVSELVDFVRDNPGLVDGFQFTIPRSVDPWAAARELQQFTEATGSIAVLYVKSTEASPAQVFNDNLANAERFAQAILAAVGCRVEVILDTFDDIDRGYFTRTGLIDRRFNPRLAGRLVSALVLNLNECIWNASPDYPILCNRDGETLTVARTGVSSPDEGNWYCPLTGNTGSNLMLDQLPEGSLVVLKTNVKEVLI